MANHDDNIAGLIIKALALKDYALPIMYSITKAIVKPRVQANNFKIKSVTPQMIQTFQFKGLETETLTFTLQIS